MCTLQRAGRAGHLFGASFSRSFSAATSTGLFVRAHSQLVTSNHYMTPVSADVYMLRAVKLEETPTGSYHNASQGIFQDLAGNFGPPRLLIRRQGGTVSLYWPVTSPGYRLQFADLLTAGDWADAPGPVLVIDGTNVMSGPVEGAKRFFRLAQP